MKVYSPEEFKVPCEVYSRVVGYLRPVNQWNDGKVEEFKLRKTFDSAVAKKKVEKVLAVAEKV